MKNTLKYYLALWRLSGVGPAMFEKLLQHFQSIEAVFSATRSDLRHAGCSDVVIDALLDPNWAQVDEDLAWQSQENCHLISLCDPRYPRLLREIDNPPLVLSVRGRLDALSKPQLAMVGSRHPTQVGKENAFAFAKHLSNVFVVNSGFALGVDAASHLGALAGSGQTIAVMGAGLNSIYPARHRDLADEVIANGALVSEFPPEVGVRASHFPMRNRIISGMSCGVLVVEAALRSGSLITARLALEQGREVFAMPGSIHNPLARGCHRLIREGAKLVESADDIFDELTALCALDAVSPMPLVESGEVSSSLDEEYQQVLSFVEQAVTSVDCLVEQTGMSVAVLSSILLQLELQGYVVSVPGGYQCSVKKYQVMPADEKMPQ